MDAVAFEELFGRMPEIAKAVNAFSSEAVQQQAFEELVKALTGEPHDGPSHSPKHQEPNEQKQTRKRAAATKSAKPKPTDGTPKKKPAVRAPKMLDIDLRPKGKTSLADFVTEKAPKGQNEQNLVALYYLINELHASPVGEDHVFTAYREMKQSWKLPSNLRNSLQVTKSIEGWIDTSDMNDIKLTSAGTNHVEHDLPPKPTK